MKKIELLAPAGNLDKLKTAFLYGADAVYLGIPDFSLRVRINDFNLETLKAGIKYAHELKKKVYVTVNIFAHNKHLKKLPPYLRLLKKLKVAALIISDPGILELAKKYCPGVPLHLSTQANCTNAAAAKFWAPRHKADHLGSGGDFRRDQGDQTSGAEGRTGIFCPRGDVHGLFGPLFLIERTDWPERQFRRLRPTLPLAL